MEASRAAADAPGYPAGVSMNAFDGPANWVGRSLERAEDAALLTGAGQFIDDVGGRPGTLHAAILRSPHAHARIRAIDTRAALSATEVAAVLTHREVMALSACP